MVHGQQSFPPHDLNVHPFGYRSCQQAYNSLGGVSSEYAEQSVQTRPTPADPGAIIFSTVSDNDSPGFSSLPLLFILQSIFIIHHESKRYQRLSFLEIVTVFHSRESLSSGAAENKTALDLTLTAVYVVINFPRKTMFCRIKWK